MVRNVASKISGAAEMEKAIEPATQSGRPWNGGFRSGFAISWWVLNRRRIVARYSLYPNSLLKTP